MNLSDMLSTDNEIQSIISKAFKGIGFSGGGNTGDEFRAYLSEYNKKFIDSDYFYKGETKFFHLSKLQNILSIINSKSIRFYDLNSSSDPNEYRYAAEAMGINPNLIEAMKKITYSFSFCPFSEVNNLDMWNKYGNTALVFEIKDDPTDWYNYHMSNIKYEVSESIHQYKTDVAEFEKSKKIKIDFDPSCLVAFHKRGSFGLEKEIRILTQSDSTQFAQEYFKPKLDYRLANEQHNKNRITKYFELPLWGKDQEGMKDVEKIKLKEKPKIIISDILIGRNTKLDSSEHRILIETIQYYILENYGYKIDISQNLFEPQDDL